MRNHTPLPLTLFLVTLLGLSGCNAPRAASPAQPPTGPSIEQFGAMRPVMRGGQTQARLDIAEAVATPHAYAVGALEGLAGEVTIIDGGVWVSRVGDDGGLRVTGPAPVPGDRATLLTLTHVENWASVPIERAAEGRGLESLIEQAARARGIDTTTPFPFLLEGDLSGLDLHVINGYCPIATDPATMEAQPWQQTETARREVVVFGIYAHDAAGVLTHHGTAVHAHAVLTIEGTTLAGHVDRLRAEPGMTLRLPGN